MPYVKPHFKSRNKSTYMLHSTFFFLYILLFTLYFFIRDIVTVRFVQFSVVNYVLSIVKK